MASAFDNLQIIDVFGTLRESEKSDWARVVFRGKWFENEPTIEIRKMNQTKQTVGGGIGISEEEADSLVKLLIDNDFGKLEDLEEAVKKRRKRFTIEEPDKLDVDIASEIIEVRT